jgi:hypothetical protein
MKKTVQWFHAGKSLKWCKTDSQTARRRAALSARKGNALATARALLGLANVSQDKETARKASSDAHYFFMIHAKKGKKK